MNVRFSLQRCKVKVIVKISPHVSLITQHFSPFNSLLFLERRKNACILGHMATSLSQDPPLPPLHVKLPIPLPFLINAEREREREREREGSINIFEGHLWSGGFAMVWLPTSNIPRRRIAFLFP